MIETDIQKRILIIIDMQYDFISGSLGNVYAEKNVLPHVSEAILNTKASYIVCTKDTHFSDYLLTLEGIKLPIEHCLKDTEGHLIHKKVADSLEEVKKRGVSVQIIEKNTFGSISDLPSLIKNIIVKDNLTDKQISLEIMGLCTDICVISNALILRAAFPNMQIFLNEPCCGGTGKKAHDAAVLAMKSCQIDIIG